MLHWLLSAQVAYAAPPVVTDAHAVGVLVPEGAAGQAGGGGIGAGIGLATGRVMPEIGATVVGLEGPAFRATVLPQARVFLGEPWSELGSLSLVAGAGARYQAGLAPVVGGGVALDFGATGQLWPRAQARYLADLVDGGVTSTLEVQLGLTWPPPSEPVLEIAEEDLPELNLPPKQLVWVPFPACEWVPTEQAPASLARFSEFDLFKPQSLADAASSADAGGEGEGPAPVVQGALLVVAWPGDVVLVDGHPVELTRDATATVNAAPGAHAIAVTGGGRALSFDVGVSAEHATWVRPPEPEPVRVKFASGSSELTTEDAAEITRIASQAGNWFFAITGSHSPEGRPAANAALAERRALIVVGLLAEAGVGEGRMLVVPPGAPDPSLTPEEQRSAVVTPFVPGAL